MISLMGVDNSGNVTEGITFNATFRIDQLRNGFNLGGTPIPRAHGSRLLETPYLMAATLTIVGYVGAGKATAPAGTAGRTSSGGAVQGFVTDSVSGGQTVAAGNYLLELQRVFKRLHRQTLCILDYGNGWFQYVRPQMIESRYAEGYPDLREVMVTVQAGDPLAYEVTATAGSNEFSENSLRVAVNGAVRSNNWALLLQIKEGNPAVRVRVTRYTTGESFIVTPTVAGTDGAEVLTIDAYRRTLFLGDAFDTPAWDRWADGGTFWPLLPDGEQSILIFSNPDDGDAPLTLTDTLTASLVARGADWLAETLEIPATPIGSFYGTAIYGVSLYG